MRTLTIGDCHFGCKNNSLTWLESQLKFFREQIFPALETKDVSRCILLGDVFDIRYSINQQIGIEVKKLFREMLNKFKDIEFVILAGNHDYYSPLEEFSEYNSYNLVFGDEFMDVHKNLKLITQDPWLDSYGNLFLPWYWTENTDHFDEILYNYDFSRDIKAIYCHADLTTWPGARIGSLRGKPVFSGHIHNIVDDELGNLHNLGAALALTFNDVNQERYIYIIEDYKVVEKIQNVTTPRFIRIYNEQIFDPDPKLFKNSFVQLCISTSNINKVKYVEQIKFLKNEYVNSNIRLHIIDDDTNIETLNVEGFNTNISEYIEENIPDHLEEKYIYIKNKIKEQ